MGESRRLRKILAQGYNQESQRSHMYLDSGSTTNPDNFQPGLRLSLMLVTGWALDAGLRSSLT
jgi:hypothetical protein